MKRILIVKPSSLGDVLHAFPAVHALCRETGAVADWLIHPAFAPLLRYLPCVENVILFDRKKLSSVKTFFPAYFQLRRALKKMPYDAVIDFQGLLRSAWFASMGKAPVHAGFAKPKESAAAIFYNRKTSVVHETHAVEKNNRLAAELLKKNDMDFSCPMPVVPEFLSGAENLLNNTGMADRMLVGIAPGARWLTKRWDPDFYAEIIVRLAAERPDAGFLLLGAADDSTIAEKIRAAVAEKAPETAEKICNLCGKTNLGELVEITRKCRLFLSNDSGPMHIAAILNVPVIAPFGATSPVLTGPYAKNSVVLQPENLDCVQCFRRVCGDMKCHRKIDPAKAVSAAMEIIREKKD